MVNMEEFMDFFKYKELGYTITNIALLTGKDRKTVRKYLKKGKKKIPGKSPQLTNRSTLLSPYEEFIRSIIAKGERLGEHVPAVFIYEQLEKKGYRGSVSTVRKYVHKKKRDIASMVTPIIVTQPGEQAQIDWGEKVLSTEAGQKVKVFLFCMVLGFSRMRFVRFYPRANRQYFLLGHQEAFSFFNGVPREMLYDQTKCAIDKPGFRKVELNRQFQQFALHYGFHPAFCKPYRPKTKGKVENLVKYVKRNMLPLYRFEGFDKLNEDAGTWCRKVNSRVHGTTNRIPLTAWEEEEKSVLVPVPGKPFQIYDIETRTVLPSSVISYKNRCYSVPPQYIGMHITVKTKPDVPRIWLYCKERLITSHAVVTEGSKYVISAKHKRQVWDVWRNDQAVFYRSSHKKKRKEPGSETKRSLTYYEQFV